MSVSNKISMEYESRAMVSEDQYSKIVNDYSRCRNKKILVNENEYFDNDDLFLTNHHMVLRKRIFNNEIEVTLKVKGNEGDIEITNNILNPNLPIQMLLNDQIKLFLLNNDIDIEKLHSVGKLLTERIEIEFSKYLLVIDKNYYNNNIDYNLEVESDSKENATKFLKPILEKYGVNFNQNYISKSRRAILKI